MNKENRQALRVGLLIFSSIAILVAFIYLMGSKDNLFRPKVQVTTSFRDIQGVVVGNNVRFSGINVGRVTEINITTDSTVMLELAIVNEYAKFIYKDAMAEISQDGLVGNKLIVISSGSSSFGSIENGTHLQSKEGLDIANMLFEVRDILSASKTTIERINSIAGKIDTGEGDIALLLNENQLTTQLNQIVNEVNKGLVQLNSITKKIEHGDGDIATLLNTNEISDQLHESFSKLDDITKQAESLLADLSETTKTINHGEGAINLLLKNKETSQNIDSTILMLQNSLTEFDETAKAIRESWAIRAFSKKNKDNNKQ